MPDLTIQTAWACATNVYWEGRVLGSDGLTRYDVTWRVNERPDRESVYGWHCSCPAFQYGRGRYCKHVRAVVESGDRCGWNEALDTGATPEHGSPNNRPICPECGGEVASFRVAV
jgi:hypothetical protein